MNIYVGNLSEKATENEVRELFAIHGEVKSVNIVRDRFTDVSRGFCFVEMEAKKEAINAISQVNGQELHGKALKVNEARPSNDPRRGGGRGGNNSGRRSSW